MSDLSIQVSKELDVASPCSARSSEDVGPAHLVPWCNDLDVSDLPAWIGGSAEAVSAATALWLGIRATRREAAAAWPRVLAEVSGMSDVEIHETVVQNPALAQIVGEAWEAAARSSAEEKTWLLARIAAECLLGRTFDEPIDPLPFLIRTVADLEPPHVRLLVLIATPRPWSTYGYWTASNISERWPASAQLLHPLLVHLRNLGLIAQSGETWSTTSYGRQLLAFLPKGPFDTGSFFQAALRVTVSRGSELEVFRDRESNISIRNDGVVRAESVLLTTSDSATLLGPEDVEPSCRMQLEIPFSATNGMDVTLSWSDPNGAWRWAGLVSASSGVTDTWIGAESRPPTR